MKEKREGKLKLTHDENCLHRVFRSSLIRYEHIEIISYYIY